MEILTLQIQMGEKKPIAGNLILVKNSVWTTEKTEKERLAIQAHSQIKVKKLILMKKSVSMKMNTEKERRWDKIHSQLQ